MSRSYRTANTPHLCYNQNENDVFSEVVNRLHQGLFRLVRKFQEANISFVMSVCVAVPLAIRVEQLNSHRTNFHKM